jgi:hypothetical protein
MAMRWYSVSVLSNFEKKIAEQIKTAVAEAGLEDEIEEVLVPTEEVLEVRRGKKVTSERRFMPGYVLVRMEMSNRGYHLISSINRVTGFLGPQGKPMPRRSRSPTGRSRDSTAWSRKWTRGIAASRCRCRSSVARRRWNWNSRRCRKAADVVPWEATPDCIRGDRTTKPRPFSWRSDKGEARWPRR